MNLDDYTFKFISLDGPYPYNWKVKVNGNICIFKSNPMFVEDIKHGVYPIEDIEKRLKEKSIKWYINNIETIRKQKLKKLNKI